jgi:hypothetical protein
MAHPQRKLLKNNPKHEKDYHYTNLVALAWRNVAVVGEVGRGKVLL